MKSSLGFTLLELVSIIVLLGIVSTFIVVRSGSDFTALQDAEELIQAIRYTQERAMQHTGDGKSYQIILSSDGYRFSPPAASIYAGNLDGLLRGSRINPTGSIRFNGRGMPVCSGGLLCDDSVQSIALSANGDTNTLLLEPYTGTVRR